MELYEKVMAAIGLILLAICIFGMFLTHYFVYDGYTHLYAPQPKQCKQEQELEPVEQVVETNDEYIMGYIKGYAQGYTDGVNITKRELQQ